MRTKCVRFVWRGEVFFSAWRTASRGEVLAVFGVDVPWSESAGVFNSFRRAFPPVNNDYSWIREPPSTSLLLVRVRDIMAWNDLAFRISAQATELEEVKS